MKVLADHRLGHRPRHVGRHASRGRSWDRFEYPVLIVLCDDRHDADDVGQRPDRALSRPRDAVARALRRRLDQPRQRALHGGWAEIFRAGRAVVGHAALRRFSLVYGFTGQTNFVPASPRRCWQGERSAGPRVRPRLRAGRPRLQDLRRAVPHVDAGRLRGRAHARHRLLRRCAQDGRDGADRCASSSKSVRAGCGSTCSRSSSSSRSPRCCSAPSRRSARSNIKRLMAYSSIGHMGFALVGLAANTADRRARRGSSTC